MLTLITPGQVVFKSLIVVHSLLRSGSLDPTFTFLSQSSLAVQLASASDAPNLSAYGHYLSARLKAYANLRRDVIRDKSDRRAAGRLRNLGVESGLLREVREVQRMIAALVESKVSALLRTWKGAVADLPGCRSSSSTMSTTMYR